MTLFVLSLLAASNLEAQHVPGTRWKQRETDRFIIIYPESLSQDAGAMALVLDEILSEVSEGLPITHPKEKWPLVLTDLGLETNGYVTLLPRRSVWYSTPGEDFTAVSDWWMLLARHEARHMAQFDAADRGFTRFLHILFGEMGWGAGIVFGQPTWLLEGDAVYIETAFSQEGRGRDPLFTKEMALIALENPEASYHRLANPSFKEYRPDPYRMGYSFTRWIREGYGDEALSLIYEKAGRFSLPIIGLDIGFQRATGRYPREVFSEMMSALGERTEAIKAGGEWTDGQIVSSPSADYPRFDSIFVDSTEAGEDQVFVRRRSLGEPAYLVRMAQSEKEKKLIRLPNDGRVSMAKIRGSNGAAVYRVAWNSLRYHQVFEANSVSDITVVDLDSRGRVLRRRNPITGSRLLYPSLSPDGSRIAAIEILRGGGSRLVILDSESGTEGRSLRIPDETAGYPSWSSNGERIVFSLRGNTGRSIAQWRLGAAEFERLLPLSWDTVKNPVYAPGDKEVIYSSNSGGTESIWSVDVTSGLLRSIARRFIAAYRPIPSANGKWLYLVEYPSASGERIVRVPFMSAAENPGADTRRPEEVLRMGERPGGASVIPSGQLRNPANIDEQLPEADAAYPERDYRPRSNAFNIHSWGLEIDDVYSRTLKLNVQARDILGTVEWETGALYDTVEMAPGAYGELSFTAIRPVFSIITEYRYRSMFSPPFHQVVAMGGLYYPVNLSRSGIWSHSLSAGLWAGIQWYSDDQVYPVASYSLQWYRLRSGSPRAFRPELGWILRGFYSHLPVPSNYGDAAAAEISLYFPGVFSNTSLSFRGGIERRTVNFSSRIGTARGYAWENPGTVLLATVDYEFPLAYPDLPLGAVIYIQRFRLGIHSDFAWIGNSDAIPLGGPYLRRWSTGLALDIDFAALNNFSGFAIGFEVNWLWEYSRMSFDVKLKGLPLF